MSLINADRFREYLYQRYFDRRLSEAGLAMLNYFLNQQPIVEAIPIEWIKGHLPKKDFIYHDGILTDFSMGWNDCVDEIMKMIEDWEKENAAN